MLHPPIVRLAPLNQWLNVLLLHQSFSQSNQSGASSSWSPRANAISSGSAPINSSSLSKTSLCAWILDAKTGRDKEAGVAGTRPGHQLCGISWDRVPSFTPLTLPVPLTPLGTGAELGGTTGGGTTGGIGEGVGCCDAICTFCCCVNNCNIRESCVADTGCVCWACVWVRSITGRWLLGSGKASKSSNERNIWGWWICKLHSCTVVSTWILGIYI